MHRYYILKIFLKTFIATLLSFSTPVIAFADSKLPGVSFDIMPIGCRLHTEFSNGDHLVRDFTEKRGDSYIVKTYKGPAGTALISTTTMNANGFAIRTDMPDGSWETFTPYSCLLEPGDCAFISRKSNGLQRTFKARVVQSGTQITTTGGFVGDKDFPTSHAKMGRFNTIESLTNGEISYKATQYEACGTP